MKKAMKKPSAPHCVSAPVAERMKIGLLVWLRYPLPRSTPKWTLGTSHVLTRWSRHGRACTLWTYRSSGASGLFVVLAEDSRSSKLRSESTEEI